MSFLLLQNAALLPIELALNGVLALDAASKRRLQELEGNTLAVRATQPSVNLFISIRGARLHLASVHEGVENASLHGAASALLGLLLRREPIDNLHDRKVELRGDTRFVQQLQTLLLDLDVDWEYQLSRVLGDIPTQAVGDGVRATEAQLRKVGSRLRDNVSEYLHEESGLLPDTSALDAFYREIGELKLRADRLQARLEALASRR